jgi:DNA-binding XRE family transcriptional regulator
VVLQQQPSLGECPSDSPYWRLKRSQNSALFPPHSKDLCVLDLVTLGPYALARKFGRIRDLPRKRNFAHYLRETRIKRRLSVAEVAEQVGVSTASIYFWETDRVRPRDANLNALCKVLKLPIRATREMAAA